MTALTCRPFSLSAGLGRSGPRVYDRGWSGWDGRALFMPWSQRRALPDDLRRLAREALERGLQVSIEDDEGALKLWVSHADLRVYQVVSTHDDLETFINKWARDQ